MALSRSFQCNVAMYYVQVVTSSRGLHRYHWFVTKSTWRFWLLGTSTSRSTMNLSIRFESISLRLMREGIKIFFKHSRQSS